MNLTVAPTPKTGLIVSHHCLHIPSQEVGMNPLSPKVGTNASVVWGLWELKQKPVSNSGWFSGLRQQEFSESQLCTPKVHLNFPLSV